MTLELASVAWTRRPIKLNPFGFIWCHPHILGKMTSRSKDYVSKIFWHIKSTSSHEVSVPHWHHQCQQPGNIDLNASLHGLMSWMLHQKRVYSTHSWPALFPWVSPFIRRQLLFQSGWNSHKTWTGQSSSFSHVQDYLESTSYGIHRSGKNDTNLVHLDGPSAAKA